MEKIEVLIGTYEEFLLGYTPKPIKNEVSKLDKISNSLESNHIPPKRFQNFSK